MASKSNTPLFQRRHYEAVAARFKAEYLTLRANGKNFINILADLFDEDNDNFNREIFMEACNNATEEAE